jgi:hypothetical protein
MNPAVYAILGSLVGGLVGGSFSALLAWQTRKAGEHAWVRDNRREIYDRFLTRGQALLIALTEPREDARSDDLYDEYVGFMGAYAVVQAVADREVVDAARTYGYGLGDLKRLVAVGSTHARSAARQVRLDRQATIDMMRGELGLTGSAKPLEDEA